MIEALDELGYIPSAPEGLIVAYCIHHRPSGMVYVGSTSEPRRRMTVHRRELGRGTHWNRPMQEAYDNDPDIYEVLYPVKDRDAAYELEQQLIDHFNEQGRLFNIDLNAKSNFDNPAQMEGRRRQAQEARDKDWQVVHGDGVRYRSMKECSRITGLSIPSIHWRIQSHSLQWYGWYFEDSPPEHKPSKWPKNATVIVHKGEEISVGALSRRSGVSAQVITQRLNAGVHPDNVLEKQVKRYDANSESHTLHEWAAKLGINYYTLHSRLKKMAFEDAIKT